MSDTGTSGVERSDGLKKHLKFDHPNVGYVLDREEDATVRHGLERDFNEGEWIQARTPSGNVFAYLEIEDVWHATLRHVHADTLFVDDRAHPSDSAMDLLERMRSHYPDADLDMDTVVTVIYFEVAQVGGARHV